MREGRENTTGSTLSRSMHTRMRTLLDGLQLPSSVQSPHAGSDAVPVRDGLKHSNIRSNCRKSLFLNTSFYLTGQLCVNFKHLTIIRNH
jgi:hypothetical protein